MVAPTLAECKDALLIKTNEGAFNLKWVGQTDI